VSSHQHHHAGRGHPILLLAASPLQIMDAHEEFLKNRGLRTSESEELLLLLVLRDKKKAEGFGKLKSYY
jgi:hypothetical protein